MTTGAGEARGSTSPRGRPASLGEVFVDFLKLGWLAFGGPVGQVGMMHLECVERRGWLSEDEFLHALNFCHVLPGPEATQLAIYIGRKQRGWLGGLLAGALFILPGYLTLSALAWLYVRYGQREQVLSVLWGFRPVGLALLLAALVRISRAALKDPFAVALAGTAFAAFFGLGLPFIAVLAACGLASVARKPAGWKPGVLGLIAVPKGIASLFAGRLPEIGWFFLKVGLFSFGGAYAVLPYLREGAVAVHHWLSDRQMIDALALGETTPGPLISIGIFVGYLAGSAVGHPLAGATVAACFLFLPSFVFVLALAPWLDALTRRPPVQRFLTGVTCGVVGLMFSVAIPLSKTALMPHGAVDGLTVALAVAAFLVVTFWRARLNVVAVVLAGGGIGLCRAFAPALFGGALP